MTSLIAVVVALLAGSSAPAPEPVGPPGSETYGREFCEFQTVGTAEGGRVRLSVEHASVPRGGTVFGRVESRSPRQGVGFGVEYHVQRFEKGMWRPAPGFHQSVWVDIGLILGPGQAGYCMRYHAPDDAPPGRYRFMRPMSTGAEADRPFYAPFRVTP